MRVSRARVCILYTALLLTIAAPIIPALGGASGAECADKADLLVLAAHPDDELLYFGGAIPYYAGERGLAVQVAYLTHTDGDERALEAAAGLAVCKADRAPVFLGFRDAYSESLDTAARQLGREQVVEALVEQIRRFRPEVVLTHDLEGEYGHGAHRLIAVCAQDAVTAAADALQYPDSAARYGAWQAKKLYLHLYPNAQLEMDWRQPLAAFAGQTALMVAKQAFLCHTSQQGYGFFVNDDGRFSCARFGLAFTLVGNDEIGGDLFENIPLSALTTFVSPAPSPTSVPSFVPSAMYLPTASSVSSAPPSEQPRTDDTARPLYGALACCAILLPVCLIILLRRKQK